MAANSTRVTRRSIANVPSALQDMTTLTNLDRLILAQAVYELGANSWSAVAKLLTKHPLLQRPKSFFTPQVSLVHVRLAFRTIIHSILVMSGHVYSSHERSRSRVRARFLVSETHISDHTFNISPEASHAAHGYSASLFCRPFLKSRSNC
jgi:hypothetical protein